MKNFSGKAKLRQMAEKTLLQIQDQCCHLFPAGQDCWTKERYDAMRMGRHFYWQGDYKHELIKGQYAHPHNQ
jgi:hypothetical protein